MNVEQWLRALAAEDETARVPPHVDAAVMAAWDRSRQDRGTSYPGDRDAGAQHRGRSSRRARVAIGLAVAGAVAASLVAAAVVVRSRGDTGVRRARQEAIPERGMQGPMERGLERAIPSLVAGAAPVTAGVPRGVGRPGPVRRVRPRPVVPPPMEAAYVIVPDAQMDAPLTMMRVRMSRTAFSRLGVPIANPDGDGLVDVEVLVGEDGVARSIRRATAVGWIDAN